MILFDNIEPRIYEDKITLPDSNLTFTPFQLDQLSKKMSVEEKILFDKDINFSKLKFKWDELWGFKGEKGLTVLTYKDSNKVYVYEFGEKQSGRFILNLLAVLNVSILENES